MTLAARLSSWLPVLPLLGILAMSYSLDRQTQPEATKPDSRTQHTPDAIVDNLTATTLDRSGMPHFILQTKQLVHYTDDDSTTLVTPDITALTPAQPDVRITALRGNVSSKGDLLELQDEVKIVRAANTQLSELVISTDYLKVFPEKELSQTDRAVLLKDAHNTVNAVGLDMDNQAQTIKLLSQVKALHVVTKK